MKEREVHRRYETYESVQSFKKQRTRWNRKLQKQTKREILWRILCVCACVYINAIESRSKIELINRLKVWQS